MTTYLPGDTNIPDPRPAKNRAVKADGQRVGKRQWLAGLGLDRADFFLQAAGIFVDIDLLIAYRPD